MSEKDLAGRCGMYCGSCPMYRASHDNDEKTKFDLAFKTRCTIDHIKCEGCGSSDRFCLSEGCVFRSCAIEKGLGSCGLCKDFPCDMLEKLYEDDMRGRGEARKNAERVREAGIEKWLDEAEARWRCKHCDSKISLDMKACRICLGVINR